MNNKIRLDREKETLLIPLHGKAMESKKKAPVLYDRKALEIVGKIDYDFGSLKIPGKTNTMMCLRAKLIDNFVRGFLAQSKECTILHLGCGLDSRYVRIGAPEADWYDLDYKEVINIRRNFFPETGNYHLIPSSVTSPEWIERIPAGNKHYLVVAEGLFMYLKEEAIKDLIFSIKKRVGRYTLVFDAYSVYTARKAKHHRSLKKTGAEIHWGIDHPETLAGWNKGIELRNEIYFTANEEIEKMGFGTKLIYRIANLFPMAKKAHRILVYLIK
jgi:O-methyltransferase involved in polyketide biosynthesis